MKTILKILLGFLVLVLILLSILFFTLNNGSVLDKVAKTAIDQVGMDIKYDSLEGGLLDGLDIKGFNYEDKVKADLKFKADFNALNDGIVHVEDLNISNLWIDETFLNTLTGDSNQSEAKEETKESFIKKLIVDRASLNLVDFHYQEYVVDVLNLQIENLSYDMKKDIQAKIKCDFQSNVADAVLNAHIKDEKYNFHIEADPKKAFIMPFVKDQNITIEHTPHIVLDGDGDFHKLQADMYIEDTKVSYQDITIIPKDLNLSALYDIDKNDLDAKLLSFIDSSAADLDLFLESKVNIKDVNNTLDFNLKSNLLPKSDYLKKYTNEHNLTIEKLPKLALEASGDFNLINAMVKVDESFLRYNDINIQPKGIDLNASYSLKRGDLKALILSDILSDVANFDLDGVISLNTKDINNTLKIDLQSHLIPMQTYFKTELADQNITIKKMPKFLLDINGDYKKLSLKANLGQGNIHYNTFKIKPNIIDINATYSLQAGGLHADIIADVDSNIVNTDINAIVNLNNKDINNTLTYKSDINILAPVRAIKEYDIKVTKPTKVILTVQGDAKIAKAILDAKGELYYEKVKIKPNIHDSKVDFDLRSKEIDTTLFAEIISTVGNLKLDTHATLDLDDLNNTLQYDANLLINDTKAFKGIDLSSLGKIKADVKGSLKDLDAQVKSPKLQLVAKSSDFDKFNVDINTKKIYIGKIYRYLPKELQNSFVNLKSDGFYKRSQNETKFTTTLRGLKYADKVISTKEFDFYMKGKDIKLSNFSLLADGFDMGIDLEKSGENIQAKINNRAIQANADITLEPLYVDAKVHVDSIEKLINEINKVYPLEVGMKVDGKLDLRANMEGEDAKIALTSDKISFEDGNIVNLNLLSLYNPKRVLVKNFDFELKDFDPKEFNRKVRLKRDGLITLDQETNTVDFALENLLEFQGTQKGDVATGKLTTKDLMLAYGEYGGTKLTTDLDMFQSKEQLAVTGFIEFADTEINYESSFLDVSKDPDIMIITRESKGKKPPSDNFLLNTFLDLDIRSKNEMLYKVNAGEIEFSPDIKVRKDFGSLPKITGKIKVIDGEYDVADKRFQIEEGAIAFRGQEGSNPLLDLNVNWEEIEDVVIMIAIRGDKNRPKLVFSSKPMMSKKDIFSYLLFGMSASETEGAATSANKAAEKIFGRAIAKDLARELNLDRLDMNRNILGGIDVKAGKKVNKKSIIYYKNKLNESSVIYERKLSKKWSVETEVGKQGQGVDIFYRKGYK